MTRWLRVVALASTVAAVGCSGDDDGTPAGDSLRERLRTELMVPLDAKANGVSMHSIADLGTTVMELDVLVDVDGGAVTLQADGAGQLLLTSMAADCGDIVITPEAFPPDGIAFTDVHVELAAVASGPADWSEADGRAMATVTGDCTVDWSVVQDTGEPLPLARQTITGVAFEVDVQDAGSGTIAMSAVGARPGDFFTWSDLVTLSELSMQLDGTVAP